MNEIRNEQADFSPIIPIILKVVIVVLFTYPLLRYTLTKDENVNLINNLENGKLTNNEQQIIKIKKLPIKQPSCPISYLKIILMDICKEIYIKNELCTPEDITNLAKHQPPVIVPHKNQSSKNSRDTRGTIVGFFTVGLLISSLGAALLELYKAKSTTTSTITKDKLTTTPKQLSLADLTVLKHNRKENFGRRESIIEDTNTSKLTGMMKVSRPPLRLD